MLCAAGMVASLPQVAFPGQSDVQVAEVVGVEQMARFGPPEPFGFGGRQYGGYGQRPITPAHLLAGLIGHATGITPGNGNNYNNYNNNYNNPPPPPPPPPPPSKQPVGPAKPTGPANPTGPAGAPANTAGIGTGTAGNGNAVIGQGNGAAVGK